MKKVTKDAFQAVSKETGGSLVLMGKALMALGEGLQRTPDYSPYCMKQAEGIADELKGLAVVLRSVQTIGVQRGHTALDEQRAKAIADVEEMRAKLREGTLRVNRRLDTAAE